MDDSRRAPATRTTEEPSRRNEPLFRPQVLAERQTQWLGTVLIAPRPSHRLFSIFAMGAAAAIVGILLFGSYAKKARVGGWLVPEQGMVRVFSGQPGVATNFFVKEGDTVRKGQPLLALSTELQSAALGDTQAHIARGLTARRDSLAEDERRNRQLLKQQTAAITDRLEALRSEQDQLKEEIALQRSRLALSAKSEKRQRELKARGFISEQQVQQAVEARLEQAAKLRGLERTRMTLQRDRLTLEAELQDLPVKFETQSADLERNMSTVEQELAETEARREIVIPAPQSGTVTAIQAEMGGRANASVPLLSIVPAEAKLEAHLYASSRAIGFLQAGQSVLLRYQAYPYQKFGHYEGVVTSISRSPISPGELPAQLAGLTSMFGSNEPVYRITVGLARQTITAYGQPVSLQPGMQLEADVVIERRRLIEWVLDPLYSFTGKWNG